MNVYNINLFQMKTKPGGQEKASEFISEGYVKIGWSKISDMTNLDKEEIRSELAEKYGYEGRSLSTNLGTLNTFTKVMKSGDVVLINHDDFVYIGIVGEYCPEKLEDNRWDHRRSCEWKTMVKRSDLKEEVKSLLRNMTTVTKFPYPFVTSGIPEILGIKDSSEQIKSTEVNQPERKTSSGIIDDAQLLNRLESLGATALSILEEEMKSEDADRRRKAAVDLLGILNNTKQPIEHE
jgi:predicted Mrr-cat superfamily restriction endonuclease